MDCGGWMPERIKRPPFSQVVIDWTGMIVLPMDLPVLFAPIFGSIRANMGDFEPGVKPEAEMGTTFYIRVNTEFKGASLIFLLGWYFFCLCPVGTYDISPPIPPD